MIKLKIGDLVYDHGISQQGIIIEIIESVVPYRVFYEDGHVDIATEHDLEILNEAR